MTYGQNVFYTWAFGDGLTGTGAVADHIYPGVGVYTAVVTASNSINFLTTTTQVEINPAITDPDLTITKTGPTMAVAGTSIIYHTSLTLITLKPLPVGPTFVVTEAQLRIIGKKTD